MTTVISRRSHTAPRMRALAAVVFGIVLASCSSTSPGSDTTSTPSLDIYERVLADAIDHGASEKQLEEIRAYGDDQEIPFSVLQDAMQRTFECFSDHGLEYSSEIRVTDAGVLYFDYRWFVPSGIDETEARDLGDACVERENAFVTVLYKNQPIHVQQRDAAYHDQRPALLECLRDYGVSVSDDATRDEVTQLATQLLIEGVVSEPTCFPPQ